MISDSYEKQENDYIFYLKLTADIFDFQRKKKEESNA